MTPESAAVTNKEKRKRKKKKKEKKEKKKTRGVRERKLFLGGKLAASRAGLGPSVICERQSTFNDTYFPLPPQRPREAGLVDLF